MTNSKKDWSSIATATMTILTYPLPDSLVLFLPPFLQSFLTGFFAWKTSADILCTSFFSYLTQRQMFWQSLLLLLGQLNTSFFWTLLLTQELCHCWHWSLSEVMWDRCRARSSTCKRPSLFDDFWHLVAHSCTELQGSRAICSGPWSSMHLGVRSSNHIGSWCP